MTGTGRAGRTVGVRPGRHAWLLRWSGRAGLSVLDQGVFSGVNFVLGVLAARWLSPEAFGAFAVAFAVYLFALGLHSAIVTDPMRVLVWKHSGELERYNRSVLGLQILSSLTVGGVLLALAALVAVLGSASWRPIAALGISSPALLGMLFLRIRCYLDGRAASALRLSLVYAIVAVIGALVLRFLNGWTSCSVVLLMGLAAVAAVFAGASVTGIRSCRPLLASARVGGVLREHWQFGRWLGASSVCYWIGAAGYLPMVGGIIGLEAAGAMRAVQALFQPLDQIVASLGLLLVPAVARRGRQGGLSTVSLWSQRISAAYGGAAALYGIGLTVAAGWMLDLLYGSVYGQYHWIVPVMALGSLASSASHGLVIGLNAAERTDAIFKSRAIGAGSSLLIGLPMVVAWELPGAVSAATISALIVWASLARFHWRAMRASNARGI